MLPEQAAYIITLGLCLYHGPSGDIRKIGRIDKVDDVERLFFW